MRRHSFDTNKLARKYPALAFELSDISAVSRNVVLAGLMFITLSYIMSDAEAIRFVLYFVGMALAGIYGTFFFKSVMPAYKRDKYFILLRMGLRETADFRKK